MYAAPVPVAASNARRAWPLAAICCLGLLGFLIVATIVLALIPVYLPNNSAVPRSNLGRSLFPRFRAQNPNPNLDRAGRIANLQALLNQLLGLGVANGVNGQAVNAGGGGKRRKRFAMSRRVKRAEFIDFLFEIQPVLSSGCTSDSCVSGGITTLQQRLTSIRTFTAPVTIITAAGEVTETYSLVLTSVSDTRPSDFGVGSSDGSASSSSTTSVTGSTTTTATLSPTITNFTAAQSGSFFNATTWQGGFVPAGNNITINIPAGIIVNIAVGVFNVSVATWSIYGTVRLGDGFNSFQFVYPTSIIIRKGGQVQDLTTGRLIIAQSGSVINQLSGGTLPAGTDLQVAVSGRAGGDTYKFISSQSSTVGILQGSLKGYNKTTPICNSIGGDIQDRGSFLGGVAPLNEFCEDNCDLDILAGFGLVTTSLGGTMNLKITKITIEESATLSVGSSNVPGFTFSTTITIEAKGTLRAVSNGGSIRLNSKSQLNFGPAATFVSTTTVTIQSFSATTGSDVGIAVVIVSNTKGPLYITPTESGVNASNTTVGGSNVSLPPASPTTVILTTAGPATTPVIG